MDEFVYNAVTKYFNVLQTLGYYRYRDVEKLLVLLFYHNLINHDYRGLIKREDYRAIESAINCLYGTSCLIPYPDYLKMGKLKLGEMTELARRVRILEDTNVLKVIHNPDELVTDPESDIVFVDAEETPGE